jgi:hypothetical protein
MMKSLVQWVFAAFLALSALALAAPVQARQEIPPIGGSGDAQQRLECPRGEFLRGVQGRTGAWIDAIQIMCAPGKSFREYDPPRPAGAMVGGGGGGAQGPAICPDTQALNSITFSLTAARQVEVFEMTCQNRLAKIYLGPSGFSVNGTVHSFQCASPSEALVGLIVNYGRAVNAIGFICDSVPYMARGFAPPPSSGPGLAPRATISGVWNMVSDASGEYRVQLTAQGYGLAPGSNADVWQLPVMGTITSARSPQFNGSFSGVMQANRQWIANYSQQNGDYGTCLFTYSADGQHLAGQCADKDKRSFTWVGRRAP